jgi:mannosyltransferase OCH1-like enzyme
MRADSARYMYMYKYGGLYADLDMECLRPMDELFGNFLAGHVLLWLRWATTPLFWTTSQTPS